MDFGSGAVQARRITQSQSLYGSAVCVRLAGCAAGCAGWVALSSAGTAQSTAVLLCSMSCSSSCLVHTANCCVLIVLLQEWKTLTWIGLVTQWCPAMWLWHLVVCRNRLWCRQEHKRWQKAPSQGLQAWPEVVVPFWYRAQINGAGRCFFLVISEFLSC